MSHTDASLSKEIARLRALTEHRIRILLNRHISKNYGDRSPHYQHLMRLDIGVKAWKPRTRAATYSQDQD